MNLTRKVTQAEFGQMVGISQPAVSHFVTRGVLSDGAPAGQWLQEYCNHLRETAAARLASGDLDLATERARLAKEQADRIAMENAVTRRELAPTEMLEEVLAKAGSRVGKILEAIPGMIRRRVPALTSADIEAIAREIAKARNIAAKMSLSDLRDDEDEGEPGTDDLVLLEDAE